MNREITSSQISKRVVERVTIELRRPLHLEFYFRRQAPQTRSRNSIQNPSDATECDSKGRTAILPASPPVARRSYSRRLHRLHRLANWHGSKLQVPSARRARATTPCTAPACGHAGIPTSEYRSCPPPFPPPGKLRAMAEEISPPDDG